MRILASQTAVALQNCSLFSKAQASLEQAARHASDLAARNAELLATQRELGAAQRHQVLDSERHRIARELHDSVTQCVLSAGMQIEVCRSELDSGSVSATGEIGQRLDLAKELTRSAVEQLRSAIYALNHPGDAHRSSLPEMLEQLATVHMPEDLRVSLRVDGAEAELPSEVEHGLLRIAGEALFNTAMHGKATRAIVRLAYRPAAVTLSISDDGTGEPEKLRLMLRWPRPPTSTVTTAVWPTCARGPGNTAARSRCSGPGIGGVRVVDPDPAGCVRRTARRRDDPARSDSCSSTTTRSCVRGCGRCSSATRDLVVVGEASSRGRGGSRGRRDEARRGAARSEAVGRLGLRRTVVVRQAVRPLIPDIGLLVLTTFLDEDLVVRAVHAGARGYVVKDVDTTELVRAIRAISAGESAFDSRSAAAVVRSLSGRAEPRQQLTDRELEVLRLLAAGLSNNKIGEKLYISATTAKFHVSNIMRKLEVSRRAEAVYAASKRGLI